MNENDKELLRRIDDLTDAAIYKNQVSVSRFLSPPEISAACKKLQRIPGIKYELYGGYEGSERNAVIIFPEGKAPNPQEYFAAIKIHFSKYDIKYSNHRMILGSLLSLGIKRDGIGDIIIDDDTAYIIAAKQMAEYICHNLSYVSRAAVSAEYIDDLSSLNLNSGNPVIVSGTVASLRIDCVLSLAMKIPRSKAAQLINDQMVYVNWQNIAKPTFIVQEGHIISVRRKGRIIINNIGGVSKKGRTYVEMEVKF
ncbi:MAG: hypothetical protein JXN65_07300 [Clostridia bacterium]|nr:hypothetical protein [Clostridia bacterium]